MAGNSPADAKRLYARAVARVVAAGAEWKISADDVADTLARSVASWGGGARGESVYTYLASIHSDDLALAIACKRGVASAWENFISTHRQILYGAARAICRDEMAAREIADSMWAELYGTEIHRGQRRSLLDYFHGRSSLRTWLRAIVAQRHIDSARVSRRFEALEKASEPQTRDDPPEPGQSRLMEIFAAVLSAALAALPARDRMRLAYYYRDELTVREIARIIGEHESTVSRKLDRTRRGLKLQVEEALRREHHMSEEQIRLCYDHAEQDAPFRLAAALSTSPEAAISQRK